MSDQPTALPGSAQLSEKLRAPTSSPSQALPDTDEAYIPNQYAGKELLTPMEAVDCINYLSGALLVDGKHRR